jgi:uncharacterized cysteine cluster protein YcgN (CxxCxxCC family)
MPEPSFWKTISIDQMTPEEWESLCDGCGRCCLFKFQDEDTEEIFPTNVVCRLLDMQTCRCTTYRRRHKRVPTCLILNPRLVRDLNWMPETCAYRLLAEGKDLPGWHPLVSGDPESVHAAGVSVRGWALSEAEVDMDHLEDYVIDTSEG